MPLRSGVEHSFPIHQNELVQKISKNQASLVWTTRFFRTTELELWQPPFRHKSISDVEWQKMVGTCWKNQKGKVIKQLQYTYRGWYLLLLSSYVVIICQTWWAENEPSPHNLSEQRKKTVGLWVVYTSKVCIFICYIYIYVSHMPLCSLPWQRCTERIYTVRWNILEIRRCECFCKMSLLIKHLLYIGLMKRILPKLTFGALFLLTVSGELCVYCA